MKIKLIKSVSIINIIALFVAIVVPMLVTNEAKASNFQQAYVRLDRMAATTFTSGLVCAKPATTSTATNIDVAVTFPAGFTVSTTAGDWATSTGTIPAGTTAWPGVAGSTATISTQTVTWTYAVQTLTAGTTYCFNWTNNTSALRTAAANIDLVGSIATHIAGPTLVDSANFALSTVASDQVQINGTVLPTFSFALSATTANFTSIGNSVVNTSSNPTVTIITNARNGWTASVKDVNNGTLTSAGTGASIPTPGAVGGASYDLSTKSGPGAFGLGVTTTGGSASPDAAYTGVSAGFAGTLSNSFRSMASSTAAATNDVVTLLPRAIASVTQAPANDYTDTLTIVAAGQF